MAQSRFLVTAKKYLGNDKWKLVNTFRSDSEEEADQAWIKFYELYPEYHVESVDTQQNS